MPFLAVVVVNLTGLTPFKVFVLVAHLVMAPACTTYTVLPILNAFGINYTDIYQSYHEGSKNQEITGIAR